MFLNSFLTTTAECSFKYLDTQCPHTLFKLKCFIFILKHSFLKQLITIWMSIMALPCTFHAVSWCTLFSKATPTNYMYSPVDCHDFNSVPYKWRPLLYPPTHRWQLTPSIDYWHQPNNLEYFSKLFEKNEDKK